jgi:hypothetical protein
MLNHHSIPNILQKILSPSSNLLYDATNSVFDLLIQHIDSAIYSLDNPLALNLPLDCFVSGDFRNFQQKSTSISYPMHLSNLVIFHEKIPNAFKKEDKIIIQNHLKDSHKLYMHQSLLDNWDIMDDKTYVVNYGLPKILLQNINRKSIIIINLNKNTELNLLYQYLKNYFGDIYMLTDISNMSLEDLAKIISSYKICIETEMIINALFAAMCGNYVVSSLDLFDPNIIGSFGIKTFTTIHEDIMKILNAYNDDIALQNRTHLETTYGWDNFKTKIENVLSTIKPEPFVL